MSETEEISERNELKINMPFPIITGAPVSSTSLPLPTPADVIRDVIASEERYEDSHRPTSATATSGRGGRCGGRDRLRRRVIGTPLVTVATDASSALSATMTISYVETISTESNGDEQPQQQQQQKQQQSSGISNGDGANERSTVPQHHGITAEVRVSIAPTASNLSKSTRETTCRVRLPPSVDQHHAPQGVKQHSTRGCSEEVRYGLTDVCPSVVFSADGRYLACLVPCPVPVAEQRDCDEASHDSSGSCASSSSVSGIVEGSSGAHRRYKGTSDRYRDVQPLSSLIIFTLKRPARRPTTTAAETTGLPAPPGFDGQQLPEEEQGQQLQQHSSFDQSDGIIVPVAASPRSLSAHSMGRDGGRGSRIDRITSICSASSSSCRPDTIMSHHDHHSHDFLSNVHAYASTSVLLAGTADGSILAVGYRRARLAGVLYRPARKRPSPTSITPTSAADDAHVLQQDQHNPSLNIGPDALISMHHVAPASVSAANAGAGRGGVYSSASAIPSECGRLAVVRADGAVVTYRTLFVPAGKTDGSSGKRISNNISPPGIERNDSDTSFRGSADLGDAGSLDGVTARAPFRKDSESSLDSVRKSIRFTPSTSAGAPGSVKATRVGSGMMDGALPDPLPRPARLSSAGTAATGGLMMRIERLGAIRPGEKIPPFARVMWFSIDTIVLLARPHQPDIEDMTPLRSSSAFRRIPENSTCFETNKIFAQIWRVRDDAIPVSVATLRMDKDELNETSHGTFQFHSARHRERIPHDLPNADRGAQGLQNDTTAIPLASFGSSLGISCHRKGSDCIALSGTLLVLAKPPDSTPSHVASRFAHGNDEIDYAGNLTSSDCIR